MKRNFNISLVNLSGNPITEPVIELVDGKEKQVGVRDAKLSAIAIGALMTPFEDERNLAGEEKVKRYKLAQKIHGAEDPIEVTAEEIALLKKLIGKGYAPLVVGQAFELLEKDPDAVV